MKKVIRILMTGMMILSLTACGQSGTSASDSSSSGPASSEASSAVSENQETSESSQPEQTPAESSQPEQVPEEIIQPEPEKKTLVAYFSWSPSGNTAQMATYIQEQTGGDILRIEPLNPYPTDYSECGEVAKVERDNNERPAILNPPDSLEEYDTILIGYPNWNADLPMPLYTFFDEYDFSGKTLIPFVTHGGSGFSGTIRTIQELEQGATVIESGLSISRNNVPGSQADVKSWIDSLREQGTV